MRLNEVLAFASDNLLCGSGSNCSPSTSCAHKIKSSSATPSCEVSGNTTEKKKRTVRFDTTTPSNSPRSCTIEESNKLPSTASSCDTIMKDKTAASLYKQAMQGNGPYDVDEETPFPTNAIPLSPVGSNATTPASNVTSSSSPHQQQQRERTNTDDSDQSVSKHTLVRLMREQVDLVRNLTNAQVAQKKELEKVKEENRALELEHAQQKQPGQTHHRHHQHHTPPQTRSKSNKLNLPTHVQRDSSDNRSVSSRSFARYFGRSPKNSQPSSLSYPRRHPDSDYFVAKRHRAYSKDNAPNSPGANTYDDSGTLANANPSLASTIMPSQIVIDPHVGTQTGAFGVETGGYHHQHHHANYTGPGAAANYNPDRIEITHIPERNVVPANEGSCTSKLWYFFSHLCTLFIPDVLLCCIGRHARVKKGMTDEQKKEVRGVRKEAKQAWREKVTIFLIMAFFSACFIGISGVIPLFLCRETTIFTMDEIKARDRAEDWTVIFGTIYDIEEYADAHPGGNQIRDFIAKDASKVFPRRPPGDIPGMCHNPVKSLELSQDATCDEFDEVDQLVKLQCHTTAVGFSGVDEYMGDYERGVFAHRLSTLENDEYSEFVMIYNRVYNVTRYIDSLKDEVSGEIDMELGYLNGDLTSLIVNKRGQDATQVYDALYDDDVALSCLDDLFYVGVVDEPDNILCQALNIAMYSVMIIIAAVLAIQCICSLIYLVRLKRTITRNDTRSKIIVMVPCYSEGDKELRKTIDSVMDTSYPDDNKVLLVVADGNITGKGERISTPETLSKILGYNMSPNDRLYKCKSIGDITDNKAKLHYGVYKDAGKELKFLVLVKCGLSSESGNPRAGNRGKRDSQLLFTGLLNRFHHGRELNDLDNAIKNALDHLQLPLDEVRYLMAIDADTRVDRESLSHMTYSMNKNDHILALCGETKVDNKSQSWVTMIQVFEYYTNHHMKKAFESVFGCVTCLPGCFTMYRLFSDDGRPLLSCDDVYQRYATNNVTSLHDKNLYHLGEDRMLTTLLLRYFPDMKLSFVPEATCYTIVPHTFSILLSQRRRWINSTFHNMLELIRVNTMCGVCCLSMKSIVILDLVATLILPASLIYVGYIVYVTFWMGEPLSLLMLVVWGIVVGVQVVVFLLRSRWDYWWWFLIFILAGVPVFYFILPLYSFWNMDDFSWGATRQVSGSANAVNSSKSGDETVVSDRESPRGFEKDDKGAENAPGHKMKSKSSPVDENVGKLNLKPKLHSSVPIDLDELSADDFSCEVTTTSKTKFDRTKYRDAEEAKRARRLRRADC